MKRMTKQFRAWCQANQYDVHDPVAMGHYKREQQRRYKRQHRNQSEQWYWLRDLRLKHRRMQEALSRLREARDAALKVKVNIAFYEKEAAQAERVYRQHTAQCPELAEEYEDRLRLDEIERREIPLLRKTLQRSETEEARANASLDDLPGQLKKAKARLTRTRRDAERKHETLRAILERLPEMEASANPARLENYRAQVLRRQRAYERAEVAVGKAEAKLTRVEQRMERAQRTASTAEGEREVDQAAIRALAEEARTLRERLPEPPQAPLQARVHRKPRLTHAQRMALYDRLREPIRERYEYLRESGVVLRRSNSKPVQGQHVRIDGHTVPVGVVVSLLTGEEVKEYEQRDPALGWQMSNLTS